MVHFLRIVWGIILFIGLTLLNSLIVAGLTASIIVTLSELGITMIISLTTSDIATGHPNPFIIFDLPKLLYFAGGPVIVEKDGEYGIRRGFIIHQYRNTYRWMEEPYYGPWPVVDSILKKMYASKGKIKKTKERVLNEYDMYVLENSHTKEYQEAMKEVRECLKQKSI